MKGTHARLDIFFGPASSLRGAEASPGRGSRAAPPFSPARRERRWQGEADDDRGSTGVVGPHLPDTDTP